MYEYCKSCVHDKGDIGFCGKCGYTYMLSKYGLPPTEYEAKPKPQTNADRIRSMTDEELAELFADNDCGYCRIHDFCFAKGCQIDCEDMWLGWLKEEAKE